MRAEGVLALMALGLTLAACNREKSFDERYANASNAIGATAAAIDAEIASRESEAAAVELVARPSTTAGATDAGSE